MSKGTLDVTPMDGHTRCEICGKPFIYGFAEVRVTEDGISAEDIVPGTFTKNPDPGTCQPDGRWTHNRCYEAEK